MRSGGRETARRTSGRYEVAAMLRCAAEACKQRVRGETLYAHSYGLAVQLCANKNAEESGSMAVRLRVCVCGITRSRLGLRLVPLEQHPAVLWRAPRRGRGPSAHEATAAQGKLLCTRLPGSPTATRPGRSAGSHCWALRTTRKRHVRAQRTSGDTVLLRPSKAQACPPSNTIFRASPTHRPTGSGWTAGWYGCCAPRSTSP